MDKKNDLTLVNEPINIGSFIVDTAKNIASLHGEIKATNSRIDSLDKRMDRLENKFDKMLYWQISIGVLMFLSIGSLIIRSFIV